MTISEQTAAICSEVVIGAKLLSKFGRETQNPMQDSRPIEFRDEKSKLAIVVDLERNHNYVRHRDDIRIEFASNRISVAMSAHNRF
eukprot:1183607-Prorocentrum_minimum.AAC.4